MENETSEQETKNWCGCNWKKHMHWHGCGCGGAIYGLGFLGALVYYLTTATSLWGGFIGLLKAIVWPAFLVYGIMKFMGM
jgi:hypothetical protein